jgi:hypothetical protein
MRAIIQRERIRIIPVPTSPGGTLWVWLKQPLSKGNQPYVVAPIEAHKKFYDLPCPIENINGVLIR